MLAGSTEDEAGKHRRITMKVTHATAMIPMGKYHLPKENGPLASRERPEVMRRNIGVA
jgi:hypothetical protein